MKFCAVLLVLLSPLARGADTLVVNTNVIYSGIRPLPVENSNNSFVDVMTVQGGKAILFPIHFDLETVKSINLRVRATTNATGTHRIEFRNADSSKVVPITFTGVADGTYESGFVTFSSSTRDTFKLYAKTSSAKGDVFIYYAAFDTKIGASISGTGTMTGDAITDSLNAEARTINKTTTIQRAIGRSTILYGDSINFTYTGGFAIGLAWPMLSDSYTLTLPASNGILATQEWTSARGSGIPAYPDDTTQYLRGDSTWAAISGSGGGDITGVTVNAPLTGGGLTGSVTISADTTTAITGLVNQRQLGLKEGAVTAGLTSQYWRGDKAWTDFNTSARAAVSGTTNQITYTGGTGVFSMSATYPGQSSITTLGTIATGVWNGTPIGFAYGGMGSTSRAKAWSLFTPSMVGKSGQVLTASYIDGVNDSLYWSAAGAGDITSVTLPTSTFSASVPSGDATFTFANQSANTIFSGPASGTATTPGWRSLVAADIPNHARSTPAYSTNNNTFLRRDSTWAEPDIDSLTFTGVNWVADNNFQVTSSNGAIRLIADDSVYITGNLSVTGVVRASNLNSAGSVKVDASGKLLVTASDTVGLAASINAKAPTASPTLTGTVTLPTGAGTLRSSSGGVVSVTASDTVGLGVALGAKVNTTDALDVDTSGQSLAGNGDTKKLTINSAGTILVRTDSVGSGVGTGTFGGLTDVDTTGKSIGSVVKWNGSKWVDSTDNSASTDSVRAAYIADTAKGIQGKTILIMDTSAATGFTNALYLNSTKDTVKSRTMVYFDTSSYSVTKKYLVLNATRDTVQLTTISSSGISASDSTYLGSHMTAWRSAQIAPPYVLDSTALAAYSTSFNRGWFRMSVDSCLVDSVHGVIYNRAVGDTVSVRVLWGTSRATPTDSLADLKIYSSTTGAAIASTKVIPPKNFVWIKVTEKDGAPPDVEVYLSGKRKW